MEEAGNSSGAGLGNVTLHGSSLYNASNVVSILNMGREEYLKAMLGPRQQEDEVSPTIYFSLQICSLSKPLTTTPANFLGGWA